MYETQGSIDSIAFADDEVRIDGWIASRGDRPVDSLRVRSGNRDLTVSRSDLNIASPDVWRVHPGLTASDRCRFHLRVPARPADQARIRSTPLTVTPVVGDGEGQMLARLLDSPLPPPRPEDIALVGGGFLEVACELYTYFIELGGLTPTCNVLDIGCGFGRVAHPLVNYLAPTARYEGFDVVQHMIDWASETITPRHPNFRFKRVDLFNKTYNPEGTLQSSTFRFPYEDELFDFSYLISVFTHMYGLDIRHYLDEIHRVTRKGGRCLATCFLMNDESAELIRQGRNGSPVHSLTYPVEDGFTSDLSYPEQAIGFPEPLFLGWLAERGFKVRGKYYGSWCGRPNTRYYHDILVIEK